MVNAGGPDRFRSSNNQHATHERVLGGPAILAAQHNQPGDAQRERDEHFMRLAIEQAQHGTLAPGGAEVGCVIVKDGELVCAGFNEAERTTTPPRTPRL